MDTVAVFGIGSTNLRYALARDDGEFRADIVRERTRPFDLERQLLAALEDLHARAVADSGSGSGAGASGMSTNASANSDTGIDAVAIATTGLVDPAAGEIRNFDTPDGESIDRIDVRPPIERALDLPVYLENDCNAAALGEWHFGARGGHDSVAHVTFGTGIGGGVVDRGRLVRGESSRAGEFGLLPVAPESGLESAGVTGAWEACCSGRGIPAYVDSLRARRSDSSDGTGGDSSIEGRWTSARDVFRAAREGDSFAQSCLDRIARHNAAGIGAICNAFNPGLLTVGGGVALQNPDWLLEGIDAHLEEFLFVDRPTLRITPQGDDIDLYGALATYIDRTTEPEAVAGRRAPLEANE